jgi:hypothetical protein
MIGIILGGTIMLFILLFVQMPKLSLSNQTVSLASTHDALPRLIALEPTSVRPQVTPTLVSPTITNEPHHRYVEVPVSPTPTPLTLSIKIK